MKKFLYIFFLILQSQVGIAQTDTQFWFSAPEISGFHGDLPIYFRFSSYEKAAVVYIKLPAQNIVLDTIYLPPNGQGYWESFFPEVLETQAGKAEDLGILIESSAPISAYYEVLGNYDKNTDIYALKGKYALGKKFTVPMQEFYANKDFIEAYSSVNIVATEDNTEITFVSSAILFFWGTQDTIKISLNKGQSYTFRSYDESIENKLAGSSVFSNKPIAVNTTDDSVREGQNWDLIGDQLIAQDYAGTSYVIPEGIFAVSSLSAINFNFNGTNYKLDASTKFSVTIDNPTSQLYAFPDTVQILFIDRFPSTNGSELAGAILPPLNCSGSTQVAFTKSTDRPFFFYLVYRKSAENDFILNGKPFFIDPSFSVLLGKDLAYAKLEVPGDLVMALTPNRLSNTKAPFQLGIANGSAKTGFELGYFSNFRREMIDTLLLCGHQKALATALQEQAVFGTITLDTLQQLNTDSSVIKLTVLEEYCQYTDTITVIKAEIPSINVSDTISFCQNTDSTLTLNNFLVRYDFVNTQKFWEIGKEQDSLFIYVENEEKCFNQKLVRINRLDSLNVIFPNDTFICSNLSQITLQTKGNFINHFLDNLPIDSIFTIQNKGSYTIIAQNQCGKQEKQFLVTESQAPSITLGLDREICANTSTIELPKNYNYLWFDKDSTNNYKVYQSGLHWVIAKTKEGCLTRDSANLIFKNFDSIPSLSDKKICENGFYTISLPKGHDNYTWADGSTAVDRNLTSGDYELVVNTSQNNELCYQTKANFKVSNWSLTVPNTITPNGDNKNENFVVLGLDHQYNFHFTVYNRWGAQIFEDLNYKNSWGATADLATGVYFIEAKVKEFDCTYYKSFIQVLK
jgi:gliding motility-associated-like protein